MGISIFRNIKHLIVYKEKSFKRKRKKEKEKKLMLDMIMKLKCLSSIADTARKEGNPSNANPKVRAIDIRAC